MMMMHSMDWRLVVLLLKVLLLVVVAANYSILVFIEYNFLLHNTLSHYVRTIVLNLRVALYVPLYAILVFTESFFVNYVEVFDVIKAIVEGYCVMCFIRMILLFIGNKEYALTCIQLNPRKFYVLDRWSREDPMGFCSFCHVCLVQFVVIRPLAILLQASSHVNLFHLNNTINKLLIVIAAIVQFTSTVLGMFGFIKLTLSLQDTMIQYLQPLRKLVYMKILIILLVTQNIFFTSLLLSRGMVYLELYCLIVLFELAVASCLLQWVFHLGGLLSYNYSVILEGIRSRYNPPVLVHFDNAYPPETFHAVMLKQAQLHPSYNNIDNRDEELSLSNNYSVKECPPLVLFIAMIINPMKYFFDRMSSD